MGNGNPTVLWVFQHNYILNERFSCPRKPKIRHMFLFSSVSVDDQNEIKLFYFRILMVLFICETIFEFRISGYKTAYIPMSNPLFSWTTSLKNQFSSFEDYPGQTDWIFNFICMYIFSPYKLEYCREINYKYILRNILFLQSVSYRTTFEYIFIKCMCFVFSWGL